LQISRSCEVPRGLTARCATAGEKAVVYSEYGGPEVLQLAEVETPAPGPNEILVKVHAAALNPVDWHFVRGAPYPARMAAGGLRRPRRHRRVACDYSGTVEAVGPSVKGIRCR